MTRPPDFKILTAGDSETVRVAVQGELDLATAPRLAEEFERIRILEGLRRVVVDLRELAFLDSTGLETIVKLDMAGRADGFEVAVVRGPRAVERLFAVLQLDSRLRLVDDPAELAP